MVPETNLKVLDGQVTVAPAKTADDVKTLAQSVALEVEPIVKHARELQVIDQQSYEIAMNAAARCGRGIDRIEKLFGEARELAHKTHKAITSAIGSLVNPLKMAQELYGSKGYSWKKAEQARLNAEELARREKEKAVKTDEKLDVAAFLDAAGAHDEAEQVLEQPVTVAPREVKVATPEGTSTRENWQWRCVDIRKLIDAVATGAAPVGVLTTADTVITKMVKALKAETKLPGIEVWDKGSVAVEKE